MVFYGANRLLFADRTDTTESCVFGPGIAVFVGSLRAAAMDAGVALGCAGAGFATAGRALGVQGSIVQRLSPKRIDAAFATWAEADRPETYYDRWVSLNTTSRALTISAAVCGVTGASLLGAGLYLMRRKR